jgi:hypothetical protein
MEVNRQLMKCQKAVDVEVSDFCARHVIKNIAGVQKIPETIISNTLTLLHSWQSFSGCRQPEWHHSLNCHFNFSKSLHSGIIKCDDVEQQNCLTFDVVLLRLKLETQ